jgi:hypothetical protein
LGEGLPQAYVRRRTFDPNYTHVDQVYALEGLQSTGVVVDDVDTSCCTAPSMASLYGKAATAIHIYADNVRDSLLF